MRTFSKKWLWILIPIAILLPFQFLTMTGLCYSEMRYLSKRELVDRTLFSENASKMSLDEKVQEMKARDGSEYPKNCRVMKSAFGSSMTGQFLSALLMGRKLYGIDCVAPRPEAGDSSEPFEYKMYSVNSCGREVGSKSLDISTSEYNTVIKRNTKYWEGSE